LAQLAEVRAARDRFDERELELIDRARYAGATWAQIAAALGLGSRQAAEQRRQRLVAATRSRRHDLDLGYSSRIAALRNAVTELQRWIDADRRWEARFPRAALVRSTAATALDATPGSLYALASHIANDLADAGPDRLPTPVRAAAARLNLALSTDD
jgi:DNA-binding transcriptional MerR regulator